MFLLGIAVFVLAVQHIIVAAARNINLRHIAFCHTGDNTGNQITELIPAQVDVTVLIALILGEIVCYLIIERDFAASDSLLDFCPFVFVNDVHAFIPPVT